MGDIVVVGTLYNDGSNWLLDLDRVGYSFSSSTSRTNEQSPISVNDHELSARVTVRLADDSHADAAVKAADNVVKTVLQLKALLNDLSADSPIKWGDRTMTAGQVLNEINRTEWRVTDTASFGNGGVTTAERLSNSNLVTMNYRAFDGDMTNNPSANNGDFASPNYTNNQGMVAALLHEVGHVNQFGAQFNTSSAQNYYREHRTYAGYGRGDDYFNNNENFANSFAVEVAGRVNFGITQVSTYWDTAWVEPNSIYADHMQSFRTINDDLAL